MTLFSIFCRQQHGTVLTCFNDAWDTNTWCRGSNFCLQSWVSWKPFSQQPNFGILLITVQLLHDLEAWREAAAKRYHKEVVREESSSPNSNELKQISLTWPKLRVVDYWCHASSFTWSYSISHLVRLPCSFIISARLPGRLGLGWILKMSYNLYNHFYGSACP